MNRLKKNKLPMIISTALMLIGPAVAAFFSKLGFPKEWIQWGLVIGMVGAGGIGVVLALYIHSIPHHDKYCRKRLEVKAWKDLGMYFYCLMVGVVSFYFLLQKGGNERNMLIVVLAVVMGIWIPIGQFVMKKKILKGLDERERLIHERAKAISESVFGSLCMMGLLGLWGWMGPKTSIPVYVPVLVVLGLGFLAEIIKPLLILIQCKMEQGDDKSIEGGSV